MKNHINIIIACILFTAQSQGICARIHPEKDYQNQWCTARGGKQEVILYDKARVDCVTKNYAIEFDFASKWGESIGQALYYAAITKKLPGIVLIMEYPENDEKYLNRLNIVAEKYGIKVWTMVPSDLKQGICTAD